MKNCAISVATTGLRLPIFFKYPYSVKLFLSSGHSPWVTRLIQVQLATVHERYFLGKLKPIFLYFLPSSKLTIFRIISTKHDAIDIADLAVCRTRVKYELRIGLAHHCLCGSMVDWSERGIRRKVQFLMRTPLSFLCPTFVTRRKNIFLYFPTELKTYHLPYSIY